MQAYQSAPCPYCGATWNPPGAQACANCHNPLPPAQPSYAPPGYAPGQGQGQPDPGQGQQGSYGVPSYAPPGYPAQPPGAYPGTQGGYPGQPGPYPGYAPPGYPGGYPQQPPGYGQQQYPGYPPGAGAPAASTTLRLFGQSFTVPVALPPMVVTYQRQIAYGALALLGLLVLFFGITPAIASGQIAAADQAVTSTVLHNAKVQSGFTALFAGNTGSDLNATKTQAEKNAAAINAALAIVQSDEAALRGADTRLTILQFVAPPAGGDISSERARVKTALDGLKQADDALTAGSNQAKVMLPTYDAMVDFTKMYAAINKHDLAGAGAPYPDAQEKLQLAMSIDHAAGVPESLAKQISAFNLLVNETESLVQAIANKDAAGTKKYSDLVKAGLSQLTPLADALSPDYQVKTYGPMQKGYDGAIKKLKG
jgi:hypothetical protein